VQVGGGPCWDSASACAGSVPSGPGNSNSASVGTVDRMNPRNDDSTLVRLGVPVTGSVVAGSWSRSMPMLASRARIMVFSSSSVGGVGGTAQSSFLLAASRCW
jgi:hypothetical protein